MTTTAVDGRQSFNIAGESRLVNTEPPPAFGYIREHFLMNAREMAAARRNLVDYAAANGFALVAIHIEYMETSPVAFQRLVNDVVDAESKAIIVPGLHHFGGVGEPYAVRDDLAKFGIRVLVAPPAD